MAELDELIIKTSLLYDEMSRILTNVKKLPKARITTACLSERLQAVKEKYESIRALHARILTIATEQEQKTDDYFVKKDYETYLTKFEDAENYINEALQKLEKPVVANVQQAVPLTSENRLPEIVLPQFDGKHINWLSFKDQFEAVVHSRNDIPDIRKLQYLRSSLTGEPERLIESFSITTAHYASAWKTLNDTYNQERLIISQVMNKVLEIRPVHYDNLQALRYMRDTVRVCINALSHYDIEIKNQFLVHSLVSKFDPAMRLKWESSTSRESTYPKFATFEKFISDRIQTLQLYSMKLNTKPSQNKSRNETRTSGAHNATADQNFTCPCCKQTGHYLYACQDFKSKDPKDRYKLVTNNKLCLNCFNPKHFSNKCTSPHRCRTCQKLHHTLLHLDKTAHHVKRKPRNEEVENLEDGFASDASSNVCSHTQTKSTKVTLLATAMVKLRSPEGREATAHVLLDSGSEISFINENLVQTLKLKKKGIDMTITGVGDTSSQRVKSLVNFDIVSRHNESNQFNMNAVVLSKVSNYRPKPLDLFSVPKWVDLQLATSSNITKTNIDIIIGVDYLPRIFKGVSLVSDDKKLIAQATIFGWVISGSVDPRCKAPCYSISTHNCNVDQLDQQLERFWQQEEVYEKAAMSPQDEQCEKYFQETTTRLPTGRFVVRLPFKPSDPKRVLGQSRHIAEMSLNRMEKRFDKDPDLKQRYTDFIEEYRTLTHMTELTQEQAMDPRRVYIPHHAVTTFSNEKIKTRVVFNAAAPTSTGTTLNDMLCAGPKLQLDLATILFNWRVHRYVFTTDIVKMYRQILLNEEDKIYQNIVWKNFQTQEYRYFVLNTVSYGTSCAPYLALKVIRTIANECKDSFPHIANLLNSSSFVDDIFAGTDKEEDLIKMRDDLITVFDQAELKLDKWLSNSDRVVPHTDDEKTLNDNEIITQKILGLHWDPKNDNLIIKHKIIDEPNLNKRKVLSLIARIFDPLGVISPITVKYKHFMQKLWIAKLDWNEPLSDQLTSEWTALYSQLQKLNNFEIPRCYGTTGAKSIQLTGFSDASLESYSCVLFLRIIEQDDSIRLVNIISKTKVAPVKTMSIPRLELSAAALLAKLARNFLDNTNLKIEQIYMFIDSKISLAWISKHPSQWNIFVANKVSYIQTKLPEAKWGYIKSKSNPADLNSRGVSVEEFINSDIWWHGPKELREQIEVEIKNEFNTTSETRKKKVCSHTVTKTIEKEPFEKYSSVKRTIRIYAYVWRFINITKHKVERPVSSALTADEVSQATMFVVKRIQRAFYHKEINAILKPNESNKYVLRHSNLLQLNPVIDENQILRVGGRLENSKSMTHDAKHPIILPQSNFAKTLIRDIHHDTMHGGVSLILTVLYRKYWIVNARNLTKNVVQNCVQCKKQRKTMAFQRMAPLPESRITKSRPFLHSAVDFAGPLTLKTRLGRAPPTQKVYIALFKCMSTKSIHLELVTQLTSDAFIAALYRFTSRRGLISTLWSDRGTNFVASNKELIAAHEFAMKNKEFQNHLASKGIKWCFNPPAASSMGGYFERSIGVMKSFLKTAIGSFIPTFEELLTIIARIEACMNSTPMYQIHDDPENVEVLTPGHFLIQEPLLALPEKSVLDKKETTLTRWKRVQYISEKLWQKWADEYLPKLQTRGKWTEVQKQIKVGDIVMMRKPNQPPCQWPLAKIIKVYPGGDGLIRVVDLQTKQGQYTRPVHQLRPLLDADQNIE